MKPDQAGYFQQIESSSNSAIKISKAFLIAHSTAYVKCLLEPGF